MKTRKQKVISRILTMVVSILLLASFFVVPVSAVDTLTTVTINNIIYNYGADDNDPDQIPFSSFHLIYNDSFYDPDLDSFNNSTSTTLSNSIYPVSYVDTFYDSYIDFYYEDVNPDYGHFGIYYVNQLFDDYVMRTFAKGDTILIDKSSFECWFNGDYRFTQFRFTLRENGSPYDFTFGKVVASTDIMHINMTEDDDFFDYDSLIFKFNENIQSNTLCLCAEFKIVIDDEEFSVGFSNQPFIIQFGSGVSPNYPIYPAAPGGDQIAGLGSAEQELLDSSAAGLDEGISIMGNIGNWLGNARAGGIDLVMFTANFNSIMNSLIDIPGINALVMISLSLGLFGSLFGLAGSIISASSRSSGQAKRDADREARKK